MRVLIQRVKEAEVRINGKLHSKINKGYLLYLGIGQNDNEEVAAKTWNKIYKLRLFADENQKTNLSIKDVEGEVLIVSQFTLYADVKGSNRPGFSASKKPAEAFHLYNYFLKLAENDIKSVQGGVFGADMEIYSLNDGPFTIFYDSEIN